MPNAAAAASKHAPSNAPGLVRRLASCLYDGLALIAVLMVAAAIWVAIAGTAAPPADWPFRVYLLTISALFFVLFWTRGETLGMRAWKLRLEGPDGLPPGWRRALLRFFAAMLSWAPLGLGFLWVLVDRDRLAWHDRLSGTRLVRREAPSRP